MNDTLKEIGHTGIVPVVVLNKVADAVPLADALIKGGLPCAEVTFRPDAAEDPEFSTPDRRRHFRQSSPQPRFLRGQKAF